METVTWEDLLEQTWEQTQCSSVGNRQALTAGLKMGFLRLISSHGMDTNYVNYGSLMGELILDHRVDVLSQTLPLNQSAKDTEQAKVLKFKKKAMH